MSASEAAPREFREEAERAAGAGDFGHLALLGHEARWFPWGRQGLALVGELQLEHQRVQEAIVTWEALRALAPDDAAAERRLAALHGKAGRPTDAPHVLLFTGHRLDAKGRADAEGKASPRFPASAEGKARRMIADAVKREHDRAPGEPWLGVAGAASGGDILFDEVCAELAIPTEVLLAAPRADYVRESVADAGPAWVRRFEAVCARSRVLVLGHSLELPGWLRGRKGYSIWERNNLWTLFHAQRGGAERVTLISLWNGKGGDGPGGTADMVSQARERGAVHIALDAGALLEP